MSNTSPAGKVVGLVPWLPWPFSAWQWWTEPVRAERLAALRIGLAGFLLLDILLTFLPSVFTFFAPDSLGDPTIYSWRTNAPRLCWSLLRGPGDRLISFLSLAGLVSTTVWMLIDLGTRALRGTGPRDRDPLRYSVPLWAGAAALFVMGVWSRLAEHDGELEYAWIPGLVLACIAMLFLLLELGRCLRRDNSFDLGSLVLVGFAVVWALILFGIGYYFAGLERIEPDSIWARLLAPWQNDSVLLGTLMVAWASSTLMLFLGLWTRPAAIATWVLSMSFGNMNTSIGNAGDTIRDILLFYLMLCPCGAVWSLDRAWRRLRGKDSPVLYISPWAIRVLFVQMVFIYFFNGLYKLHGANWRDGNSLYYVLGDITLARFARVDLPLPLWAFRAMTWSVLAWEVSFPLLVLNRWVRPIALLFGVSFHLGIFAMMELGSFVPYALCMYAPLVPWERLIGRRAPPPNPNDTDDDLPTPVNIKERETASP